MPAITRWQPFREFASLQERMNQLFNDFFPEMNEPSSLTTSAFAPRTDVYEEDEHIVLDMELPEMRQENLNLTLEGNTLTICGERKIEQERKRDRYHRIERSYGNFSRTFTLPATVDSNSVDAKYGNGILHVSMAKRADARPHQIKIGGQSKQIPAKAA